MSEATVLLVTAIIMWTFSYYDYSTMVPKGNDIRLSLPLLANPSPSLGTCSKGRKGTRAAKGGHGLR